MNREEYEDLYRRAWLKQLDIDKANNKKLQTKPVDYNKARENALKGGRPKKLSDKAAVINRMIVKGMTMREIGDILGISHQAVIQVKQRYGLPRHAEIKSDK
jgi:hypothetical protein